MPFSSSLSCLSSSSSNSFLSLQARSRVPCIYNPQSLILSKPRYFALPLLASRRPRDFIDGRDDLVDDPRNWNRKVRPEYVFDEDYDGEDDDGQEDEDRSLDLLVRFVENVFRKISKRARKAVRSVLPVSISTKLVGFSVNGVLILAFLWISKAFLEVACALGTIVFTSILLIRGLWAGVTYIQESRSNNMNELGNDPSAWSRVQPVS
ncbi:PREDICTED: uncharacterized protein LOC104807209 [Tarenaya hassleriana]|uniref:uncharacterized protein LOC104807209 n=1 Tax=Tarenaya hassleriana TaxID=28532 RepID=UPI00053C30B0|nr:PREDICTED: uncharacterized protein LOC104807209 [Tarenaya hassleriana]